MKTAQELLKEYGCPEIPFNENITMFYPAIINAMEEYANQFRSKIPKDEADLIEEGICEYYGVTVEQIVASDTSKNIVEARSVLFYLLKLQTRLTLAAIGERYGRDHSTVLNGNKKVRKDWLVNDRAFIRRFRDIVKVLFEGDIANEILNG